MNSTLKVRVADGELNAFVAHPASGKGPVVVVLQ